MQQVELDINRRNTEYFINERPSVLELIPRIKERTSGAGYKLVDQPARQPQTFRIIELGMQTTPPLIQMSDGVQRQVSFWLLGLWDADVAIDDYWVAEDGREWIVGDVVISNKYETRGLVVERGR